MSNVIIPTYLMNKLLPTNGGNIISKLKEKYNWKTYADINENELKKVYNQDFDVFWTVIKYLSFQGFEFSGRLSRYNFSSNNGNGYILFLQKEEHNSRLDFDYKYAFLKIQLAPNGIHEKYDLHLVPIEHILNEYMNFEKATEFFSKEGFSVIKTDSINLDNEFSVQSNNKEVKKSTEKNLVFQVGNFSYSVPCKSTNISLSSGIIPASKVLSTLIKRGYKRVIDLPSDLSFLLTVPQVGQRSVEKFFLTLGSKPKETTQLTSNKNYSTSTITEKGGFLYLGEFIPFKDIWMQIPIMKDYFGQDVLKLFFERGIKVLGDLPYEIEEFFRSNGYKKIARRELSTKIYNHLPIQGLQELLSRSLNQFIINNKPPFLEQRDWEIVFHRLEESTLEEIGEKYNVTRERVRQIVRKSLDKMFKRYQKYFDYLEQEIKDYVFINIYDLFKGKDKNIIKLMRSLVNVYSMPFYVYDDYLSLYGRDEFLQKLKSFKSDITNDKKETHLYSREEIEKYVVNFLTINSVSDKDLNSNKFEVVTNQLICESFESTNQSNLYTYKQKFSKARMCQIVFEEEFADGLDIYKKQDLFIKKLLEYFPEEFKNDSARSIIANLTRDENKIVLWRLGFFKHISAVHPDVNTNTLSPIKEWLQSQLSDKIKQINTNIAFSKFEDELKRLEIDTEHALFSLLKIHFPDAFNYSRSPTLVTTGQERLEKKKVLEKYVKNNNGYISNEDLTNYFINTIGWTKTMFEQNISASEVLLKTSNGLVHIDCLNIEKEELEGIFLYAKKKMNHLQNSYSIETIFEERKSTLLQMNIKDSRVLYHLLEKYYTEEFDFYRFPHIHPVGKYKTEQLSVVGQFETFFLENEDYFLRDELYEEFVQERGWAMSTYYMAYSKNKEVILEVFPEEFAHVNLIEWNKEKKTLLIEVLENFLHNSNKPFIHIERDIINNDILIEQFPSINPTFEWNYTLLISILQTTNNFILLGTKKAGILSKDNSFGIKNEQDFISYLLKNKYDGYVKVSELQKYLYSIDMCGNSSIPNYYLKSDDRKLDYQLTKDEVILKELMVR
ncbi:sigma factor-like helix-turn-helix DNA-binding protein [Paucisalibacillus globulus]|uniref:sigma factor-like helix-turn-helix DNA-binding protein n=1 Tax=Paucisalibacillus globulus TaxID=351095 RepID=UPI000BB6C034|nr:sigma factor-like helix-turn-helix DNA-binding protein [Paucisalibacillus globulus]